MSDALLTFLLCAVGGYASGYIIAIVDITRTNRNANQAEERRRRWREFQDTPPEL